MKKKHLFPIVLTVFAGFFLRCLKKPLDYCESSFEPSFVYQIMDTIFPVSIQLINTTSNPSLSMEYQWVINGDEYSNAEDTTLTVTNSGNYSIQLIVKNCSDAQPKSFDQIIDVACLGYPIIENFMLTDIGTRIYRTKNDRLVACGISGKSISSDSNYMWIGLFEKTGQFIKADSLGELGKGEARDVIELDNGNYLMCGTAYNEQKQKREIILVEYTPDLDRVGVPKSYGGIGDNWGLSVIETNEKELVVVGCTEGTDSLISNGEADIYVLKLYSNGDVMWETSFGGPFFDCGYDVLQTSDDGFMVCGVKQTNGLGDSNGFVAKISSTGALGWVEENYVVGGETKFGSIESLQAGNIILGGYTTSGSQGGKDAYLVRIDEQGNELFLPKNLFGENKDEEIYEVRRTTDGGFIAVGYQDFATNQPNVYILKIDASGALSWSRNPRIGTFQRGASVVESPDCGYIIFGTVVVNGDKDFLILKTNEIGK